MLAMQRGTFETVRDSGDASADEDDVSAPKDPSNVVAQLGFNLHAGVTIAAHDDLGRERVRRYGARPPFSLAELRVLRNGNVSYLVKKVGRGRAKHRVMEPVEFLCRASRRSCLHRGFHWSVSRGSSRPARSCAPLWWGSAACWRKSLAVGPSSGGAREQARRVAALVMRAWPE